ncbi:peptidoglycan-binding domain-containing protein [Teredinibacter turnerae]|uniref:peptidoglycan-binding domain-containing protein n=1 Tax=Teredinibacter turnerae TaxID=2426 RepID=UPI0030CB0155
MYIKASVGTGGINITNDVKFIQELLTHLAMQDMRLDTLTADGICGAKTKSAIATFQKNIVKLKTPDGRIDPNGRSEKTLIVSANNIDKSLTEKTAKKYGLAKSGTHEHHSGLKQIVYRANARRVLSDYSTNVVKLAMSYAGIFKCDISSTLRTFDDQTRIMYNNCSSYPNATSVSTLRAARGWGYAEAGRAVEAVYFAKKAEGETACKAAMKEKISSLYRAGKKVSLHCVSESDYKLRNVLDIPYSSVQTGKRQSFERALMGMAKHIQNSRYTKPAQGDIYIDKLIIEDKCWHLEIPQTGKTIATSVETTKKTDKTANTIQPKKAVTLESTLNEIVDYFQRFL